MKAFERLIGALKRLLASGPSRPSASRSTCCARRAPKSKASSMPAAKATMRLCARCGDFTDKEICRLCSDPARDAGVICVVEETQDLAALERSRAFGGLYHVLHGSLSPLDGIGPDRIKAKELVERVRAGGVREIVLATDPDTEGEATALYLAQILKPFPVKVTRIAHGVPLGGDLDYLDERTLSYALSGRREV